jgi:FixJ family two-component response regulator
MRMKPFLPDDQPVAPVELFQIAHAMQRPKRTAPHRIKIWPLVRAGQATVQEEIPMTRSDDLLHHGKSQTVAPRGMISTAIERPQVLIVDDDDGIRSALLDLMSSVGLDATCFAATRELLELDLHERPGCLVLDVRMPGLSGLELQRYLVSSGNVKPIIFLTGHGDIPMSVQAMKAGAVDFLTKPVRDQALLDAVTIGIERDIARRAAMQIVNRHASHFNTLTQRERQVLQEVARGRINKQIAFDLGISEITVKLHRGNAMRKMQVASVGALMRAWEALPARLREKEPL